VAQVHFDVYPAGDIYLTPEDMARFLAMHLNDGVFRGKRIISEASARKMREPQFGGVYGFGFTIRKDSLGHTIISHSGGIPGQSSFMMGDVDAKVGVYYMSNSGAPSSIATAAITLLRGGEYKAPTPRKAVKLDTKILDKYVGSYQVSPDMVWAIVREGDGLFRVPSTGGAKTPLLAETPTRFFIEGQDLTITFVMNSSGSVDKLEVDAGGGSLSARRRGTTGSPH
jgi:CubicO group peptidase (beta-lactamase class C family)